MSTPDQKREIARLNAELEKRGAKSRYIDADPEDDYTFSDDQHAVDALATEDGPTDEMIEEGKWWEQRVAEDLKERGLDAGMVPFDQRHAPDTREQTLDKMIRGVKQMLGVPYEHHLDEYLELTGTRHEEDSRGAEQA